MIRSTAAGFIGALCLLGGVVALGLDTPVEELHRAPTVEKLEGAEPDPIYGPQAIRMAGPETPSVPALTLRSASAVDAAAERRDAPSPVRLRVPSIDVDAPIVPAGVDANGQFDVPQPDQVGWYEHGPLPGAEGSSVLAAHVDFGHEPGAFFSLSSVLPGDHVYVDFDDGSTATFEVMNDTLYDKSALPQEELFRQHGEPVVQLVTCGGDFDQRTNRYVANRVVTARPVD